MISQGEAQLLAEDELQGQLRIGASDTICRYFLIDYLKRFHQDYPGVRIKVTNSTSIGCVELLGTGELLAALKEQSKELGIEEAVEFAGYVSNPYAYYAKADCVALSSRYEGLPTVLIEALACGARVVSTDCPCGPREILEDGKYYPMMKAVSGRTPGEIWTREEEMFGKLLLERLHPVLYKYLQRELRIREEISGQLKNAAGEGAKKRLDEVEEEKRLILAALQRYEGKGTDRLA